MSSSGPGGKTERFVKGATCASCLWAELSQWTTDSTQWLRTNLWKKHEIQTDLALISAKSLRESIVWCWNISKTSSCSSINLSIFPPGPLLEIYGYRSVLFILFFFLRYNTDWGQLRQSLFMADWMIFPEKTDWTSMMDAYPDATVVADVRGHGIDSEIKSKFTHN